MVHSQNVIITENPAFPLHPGNASAAATVYRSTSYLLNVLEQDMLVCIPTVGKFSAPTELSSHFLRIQVLHVQYAQVRMTLACRAQDFIREIVSNGSYLGDA